MDRGLGVNVLAEDTWKKNTLSMESKGWRFIIYLHTQMVVEEAGSSNSKGEDEGKKQMELDEEGVLWLESGSKDENLDSVNGLFHW